MIGDHAGRVAVIALAEQFGLVVAGVDPRLIAPCACIRQVTPSQLYVSLLGGAAAGALLRALVSTLHRLAKKTLH